MEIYILRHGIAEDAKGDMQDAERALTDEGRERLKRILERARAAGVKPTFILTSPYKRALQTAQMAGHILECRKIDQTEALVPGATPQELWEAIRERRREGALLLSGHEPLLSMTAAFLLGAPELQVDLKKGAIVRIDQDKFGATPRGTLKWMLTPRLV